MSYSLLHYWRNKADTLWSSWILVVTRSWHGVTQTEIMQRLAAHHPILEIYPFPENKTPKCYVFRHHSNKATNSNILLQITRARTAFCISFVLDVIFIAMHRD